MPQYPFPTVPVVANPSTSPNPTGDCLPVPKDYAFTYTIPNANQTVENLAQLIDTDADFYLRGVMFVPGSQAISGHPEEDYSIQFQDASLFRIQSELTPWQLLAQGNPLGMYIVEPQLFFPKGSRILISLMDTSGVAGNQVQILFRGVAKYYV